MDEFLTLRATRMAHGSAAIAHADDGRIVLVDGALPGDLVRARIKRAKKSVIFAVTVEVLEAGPMRGPSLCQAAAAGAGCCDYHEVLPERAIELKAAVLSDQLRRIAQLAHWPEPELIDLAPYRAWRTRVRLGVDAQGQAGVRARGSHDIIAQHLCSQPVSQLSEALAGRFQPGTEVIGVYDSQGTTHIVQTQRPARGRRVESVSEVLAGSGTVTEYIDLDSGGRRAFEFPATGFWQAHQAAPQTYNEIIYRWLSSAAAELGNLPSWDLYGGVGALVPALQQATGTEVHTVDYSPSAPVGAQDGVVSHRSAVDAAVGQLPRPGAVVLDPPRSGAGEKVVAGIVAAQPEVIIHIGCDPATFARDIHSFAAGGYLMDRLAVIDAFPGTHHSETIARLVPAPGHRPV